MKRFRTRICILVLLTGSLFERAQLQAQEGRTFDMSPNIYTNIMPKVVRITCKDSDGSKEEFGSGVIVAMENDQCAIILTACHVVAKNYKDHQRDPDLPLEFYHTEEITIDVVSEAEYKKAVVLTKFFNAQNDLVLLKTIDPISDQHTISYNARADEITPGQAIAVLGYPQGSDYPKVALGYITGTPEIFFSFNAKTVGGNSGGPIIDDSGAMVGMVTSIQGDEGFAIRLDVLFPIVNKWLKPLASVKNEWWPRGEGRTEDGKPASEDTSGLRPQSVKPTDLPELNKIYYNTVPPVTARIDCEDSDGATRGSGALVAVTKDQHLVILTVRHLVDKNFDPRVPSSSYVPSFRKTIKVQIGHGATFLNARVMKYDLDLALIETQTPYPIEDLILYTLKDSLKEGNKVLASGYVETKPEPKDLDMIIIKHGFADGILTKKPEPTNLFFRSRTSGPGPAFGGGPVINGMGHMLGILQRIDDGGKEFQAIPIAKVVPVVNKWLKEMRVEKKWQEYPPRPAWKNKWILVGGAAAIAAITTYVLWSADDTTEIVCTECPPDGDLPTPPKYP